MARLPSLLRGSVLGFAYPALVRRANEFRSSGLEFEDFSLALHMMIFGPGWSIRLGRRSRCAREFVTITSLVLSLFWFAFCSPHDIVTEIVGILTKIAVMNGTLTRQPVGLLYEGLPT